MVVGYCMKCKQKREMVNETAGKTSRGTTIYKGECSKCGTKMAKIGG